MTAANNRGFLLIISGPAGVGKTTLCERLVECYPSLQRLVTTTTRKPRDGEVDGIDYHFLTKDEFQHRMKDGAFIEWAKVHSNYYGSQRRHIEAVLESGNDVLLNIDIQGARAFRSKVEAAENLDAGVLTVFIRPENIEQIKKRLIGRDLDSSEEIQRRLLTAEEELKAADEFDHCIVSGSRDADFEAVRQIYEKHRQNL
ncbi:MAG: guanylate kinase [Opitutales bacterium]|nr:guanylate kinase [Opitutales bacterium]